MRTGVMCPKGMPVCEKKQKPFPYTLLSNYYSKPRYLITILIRPMQWFQKFSSMEPRKFITLNHSSPRKYARADNNYER